jgi:hypothetical protein
MSTDFNKLFMDGPNIFDDEFEPKSKPKKLKRERVQGEFYLCPKAWADRAAEVCGQYLIFALRLQRRWLMREPGTNSIPVTASVMEDSQRIKRQRLIAKLQKAGLIVVTKRAPGQAIRIRVIDLPVTPKRARK